ncbi:molybdenum cofactor biosynthesis protein MoaE, partial [Campylobacter jejuni]|nr:molybdenum cofactor biosynthesis protein MoaE [Campylobacter jejuni]
DFDGISLLFAHSIGDVAVHESSYFAGILSKQRKLGLKLLNEFVEDFKASAPIWKYDVINKERIYAKERSTKLCGAGLLKG